MFIKEISRGSGLAVVGYDAVKNALQSGKVSKLLISEDIELHKITYQCEACKATFTNIEINDNKKKQHECGGQLDIISDEDAIEELIRLADMYNVEVLFISSESSLGKEFLMGFKGVGALLKG